jgi:large subunit ribosomal protein L4
MKVQVHMPGKPMASKTFDAAAFGERVLFRTLKDAVVMFQANQRQGNAKTKERGEVQGSQKKPWKQKHTGRARAGDKRSPLWRGGGTIFGPRPRSYVYHMPAKARRVALRGALYGKLEAGEVCLFNPRGFTEPSAKSARALLSDVGAPRRALVVTRERDPNVWKSFRNFPGVEVRPASDVCAHDVAAGGLLLIEEEALVALGKRVGVREEAKA